MASDTGAPADGGPMIRTADVRVDYDDVTAVRGLSFEVARGEVFGLIGPNGSGKTSTIRVLATLLEPTYGEVFVGGFDTATHAAEARAVLGYMPDLAPVHDDLTCFEFLDQFAGAYGLPRRDRRRRVEECLELVDLTAKRNAMAGTLSRGMTQRLVLAKTLLHRPAVMLLDEPASGLDPLARADLRDLLRRLAGEGVTVLISSHILTELSGFCTSVGIMEQGEMKHCGRIEELSAHADGTRQVVVELLEPAEAFVGQLDEIDQVSRALAVDHTATLTFAGDEAEVVALLRSLVEQGMPVRGFYERRRDIEDLMRESGAKEVS